MDNHKSLLDLFKASSETIVVKVVLVSPTKSSIYRDDLDWISTGKNSSELIDVLSSI
jgi:hypothetical protein